MWARPLLGWRHKNKLSLCFWGAHFVAGETHLNRYILVPPFFLFSLSNFLQEEPPLCFSFLWLSQFFWNRHHESAGTFYFQRSRPHTALTHLGPLAGLDILLNSCYNLFFWRERVPVPAIPFTSWVAWVSHISSQTQFILRFCQPRILKVYVSMLLWWLSGDIAWKVSLMWLVLNNYCLLSFDDIKHSF